MASYQLTNQMQIRTKDGFCKNIFLAEAIILKARDVHIREDVDEEF